METTFTDNKGHHVSVFAIECEIDFTREQYENKRNYSKSELVDFDDFLENVVSEIKECDGTFEDAIFIANDAFSKL